MTDNSGIENSKYKLTKNGDKLILTDKKTLKARVLDVEDIDYIIDDYQKLRDPNIIENYFRLKDEPYEPKMMTKTADYVKEQKDAEKLYSDKKYEDIIEEFITKHHLSKIEINKLAQVPDESTIRKFDLRTEENRKAIINDFKLLKKKLTENKNLGVDVFTYLKNYFNNYVYNENLLDFISKIDINTYLTSRVYYQNDMEYYKVKDNKDIKSLEDLDDLGITKFGGLDLTMLKFLINKYKAIMEIYDNKKDITEIDDRYINDPRSIKINYNLNFIPKNEPDDGATGLSCSGKVNKEHYNKLVEKYKKLNKDEKDLFITFHEKVKTKSTPLKDQPGRYNFTYKNKSDMAYDIDDYLQELSKKNISDELETLLKNCKDYNYNSVVKFLKNIGNNDFYDEIVEEHPVEEIVEEHPVEEIPEEKPVEEKTKLSNEEKLQKCENDFNNLNNSDKNVIINIYNQYQDYAPYKKSKTLSDIKTMIQNMINILDKDTDDKGFKINKRQELIDFLKFLNSIDSNIIKDFFNSKTYIDYNLSILDHKPAETKTKPKIEKKEKPSDDDEEDDDDEDDDEYYTCLLSIGNSLFKDFFKVINGLENKLGEFSTFEELIKNIIKDGLGYFNNTARVKVLVDNVSKRRHKKSPYVLTGYIYAKSSRNKKPVLDFSRDRDKVVYSGQKKELTQRWLLPPNPVKGLKKYFNQFMKPVLEKVQINPDQNASGKVGYGWTDDTLTRIEKITNTLSNFSSGRVNNFVWRATGDYVSSGWTDDTLTRIEKITNTLSTFGSGRMNPSLLRVLNRQATGWTNNVSSGWTDDTLTRIEKITNTLNTV